MVNLGDNVSKWNQRDTDCLFAEVAVLYTFNLDQLYWRSSLNQYLYR